MSSERLEEIEDELKALLDQVQNSVTYQLPTKVGDDRRRAVNSLDGKLTKVESLVSLLDLFKLWLCCFICVVFAAC